MTTTASTTAPAAVVTLPEDADTIRKVHVALMGETVNVSIEPYYAGTARVIDVRQGCEYGRPDRPLANRFCVVVEAIDMTETSRLGAFSSSQPVAPGLTFELYFHTVQADFICESRFLRNVSSV